MSPPLTPINPSCQLESRVPASCRFPVSCDLSIGQPNEPPPTRDAEYSPATREGGGVKCGSLSATPSTCAAGDRNAQLPDRSADDHRICSPQQHFWSAPCTTQAVTQPHGAPHDPVTNDELSAKFHAAGRPRHRRGERARSSARSSGSTISAMSVTSSTCSRCRYEAHSAEGTHHDDDARTPSFVGSAGAAPIHRGGWRFRRNFGAPGPTHGSGCGLHDRCRTAPTTRRTANPYESPSSFSAPSPARRVPCGRRAPPSPGGEVVNRFRPRMVARHS
jgi:hypothetical protein